MCLGVLFSPLLGLGELRSAGNWKFVLVRVVIGEIEMCEQWTRLEHVRVSLNVA